MQLLHIKKSNILNMKQIILKINNLIEHINTSEPLINTLISNIMLLIEDIQHNKYINIYAQNYINNINNLIKNVDKTYLFNDLILNVKLLIRTIKQNTKNILIFCANQNLIYDKSQHIINKQFNNKFDNYFFNIILINIDPSFKRSNIKKYQASATSKLDLNVNQTCLIDIANDNLLDIDLNKCLINNKVDTIDLIIYEYCLFECSTFTSKYLETLYNILSQDGIIVFMGDQDPKCFDKLIGKYKLNHLYDYKFNDKNYNDYEYNRGQPLTQSNVEIQCAYCNILKIE